MNILVTIKQVPDMESRFQPQGTSIDEADLAFRMNEYDEFAVEAAVQLKESIGGAEVTCLTIGPERAAEALKKALAMGCDKGIHIVDESAKSPLQKARMIAKAAEGRDFDLVFCGMQSQDFGSAQTGILLSEILGIEAVSTVVEIKLEGNHLEVKRELEEGRKMKVKLPLPAVLTCQLGLNTPRYPTLPNIMKAKKKPIEKIEAATLEPGEALVQTTSLHAPEKKGSALILEGDVAEVADKLVQELKSKTSMLS